MQPIFDIVANLNRFFSFSSRAESAQYSNRFSRGAQDSAVIIDVVVWLACLLDTVFSSLDNLHVRVVSLKS
jgi:hypothetical protein